MDARVTSARPLHVAIFLPSLAGGGAERVTLALADGLAQRGVDVDLVLRTAQGDLSGAIPDSVTTYDLAAPRTLAAARDLRRYLRRQRPNVLISALSHANIVATLVARSVPRGPAAVVMHHNTTSLSTRQSKSRIDRLLPALCGLAYRIADRIVAVSHGVARDLARSSHLPLAAIDVVANPIDYERIDRQAGADLDVSLLPDGAGPLVLAAGRFETQKAFDVLLEAVARSRTSWRLLILGEGTLRPELEAQVQRLGLADRVRLPGFVANPYPYFRAADVLALSSRWEGLPTVLVEALAFELRIVSTDCPSGPDEILTGVPGTELVPVGDPAALAEAIDRAVEAGRLTTPRPAWQRYDKARVLDQMIDIVRQVDIRRQRLV